MMADIDKRRMTNYRFYVNIDSIHTVINFSRQISIFFISVIISQDYIYIGIILCKNDYIDITKIIGTFAYRISVFVLE